MDRCKKKDVFTLHPLYHHFVTKPIDINIVDAVTQNNRVDMLTVSTTVKIFIKLLFEMKVCLEKVLRKDYAVEVYHSLDYIDEWVFDKDVFELSEHGDFKKLPRVKQFVAVRLASKPCSSTTIQIYSL